MGRLDGKVAVVTGGGGGFGKAIAEKFIQEGAKVLIADMAEDVGKKTSEELKAEFVKANVTDRSSWEEIVKVADDKFGKIDIVVNNAGTTYRNQSTLEVSEADFEKVMSVNVKSIFNSASVVVPYIQKKGNGGSFITIASTAGIRPRPGLTWYNASKAAAINGTNSMAVEFAKDNIRFNSICPVLALGTGLTELFLGKPENEKAFMATVPLGRGTSPKDVANVACFLASDEADYITGIAMPCDGGRCV